MSALKNWLMIPVLVMLIVVSSCASPFDEYRREQRIKKAAAMSLPDSAKVEAFHEDEHRLLAKISMPPAVVSDMLDDSPFASDPMTEKRPTIRKYDNIKWWPRTAPKQFITGSQPVNRTTRASILVDLDTASRAVVYLEVR